MHWLIRSVLAGSAVVITAAVGFLAVFWLGLATAGLWGRFFIRNSEEGPKLMFISAVCALMASLSLSVWAGIAVIRYTDVERRRREKGACVKCGYNLTGNVSGVCPECGEKI